MLRGIIAAAILVMAATAASAGPARLPDESNARVISVSTHSDGTAHQRLTMALDKAAIVQLDTDARDVLVSNPGVVDAVVRSPRRIFLIANKTGQTNAFFFDAKGHQILSIDIRVERDVTDLGGMLRANFPDSTVKVSAMNDNVVLTGTIGSAMDSTRAQDLAARFAGGADKVVNMLKIDAGEQVMLKVRIVEVQREIAKQFGINLEAAANAAGVPIIAATANPFGLLGRALSDASGVQIGNVGTTPGSGPNNVQGILKALEQVGLVHTLAEPNLTAVSGETAKFLAGGEFPVPGGRDSQGNIAIIFKQFGVGLSFTPVVLSRGRISMQISTEVSELTNTGAFTLQGGSTTDSKGNVVTVGGLTIPALRVRRAETTVELPSGGSFAIAGLLQHTNKQTLDSFPGLKDMPVLGALFRSRDFQNEETELVVVVTPYLVNPVNEKQLATPSDGFEPATDPETILTGRLNSFNSASTQSGLKSAGLGKTGFIVE
ncbi:MAG TPA: type II and III secretion system protein family protein [Rhizomicrobium sp.]|nr:type II and III secretion system protein family protein [Rhizomicrobium sp.]